MDQVLRWQGEIEPGRLGRNACIVAKQPFSLISGILLTGIGGM